MRLGIDMVVAMESVCPAGMIVGLSLGIGLCPAVGRILAAVGLPLLCALIVELGVLFRVLTGKRLSVQQNKYCVLIFTKLLLFNTYTQNIPCTTKLFRHRNRRNTQTLTYLPSQRYTMTYPIIIRNHPLRLTTPNILNQTIKIRMIT